MEHELVNKARTFAAMAHAGVVRKWTGEPYVEHCGRVAGRIAALGLPAEVVAAAWLHDVVEDTPISVARLNAEFGPVVASLVEQVTNPKIVKTPDNRALRKAAVIVHLAAASYHGACIKLADMADNSANVAENDPVFAKGYLAEMAKKLAVLGHGHPELVAELKRNLSK